MFSFVVDFHECHRRISDDDDQNSSKAYQKFDKNRIKQKVSDRYGTSASIGAGLLSARGNKARRRSPHSSHAASDRSDGTGGDQRYKSTTILNLFVLARASV